MEQLLAETHPQDFQQLQQELLQQQSQDPNQQLGQQLDQQLDFALQQTQFQSSQPMDLLMSDQSEQVTSMPTRIDDDTTMNSHSMIQSTHMPSEMDQMLDIDFMQVLKCFESAPAGENLGDLAGGLSLFNDMDVMNIGKSPAKMFFSFYFLENKNEILIKIPFSTGLEDVVTTSMSRESRTQEMLSDIEKKREKMIRECDYMMRRLRKVQARHMGRHVSEEVGGLFEYTQQMLKRKERETKSISTMTPINQLHSDKNKTSSTPWRQLIRKIEGAANSQHKTGKIQDNSTADHYTNNASSNSPGTSIKPTTCVPTFDTNGIQQLKQCAGLLNAELKLVGKSFDSDATER